METTNDKNNQVLVYHADNLQQENNTPTKIAPNEADGSSRFVSSQKSNTTDVNASVTSILTMETMNDKNDQVLVDPADNIQQENTTLTKIANNDADGSSQFVSSQQGNLTDANASVNATQFDLPQFESPQLLETPRPVRYQQNVDNFHKYPLPSKLSDLDNNAFINRIENQNELYFVPLKQLCEEYYQCNKIMHLVLMR